MERELLKREIEKMTGMAINTPADYTQLSDLILQRTKRNISATTLKRIFGYINDGVTPRANTLDTLAQFMGYKNYKALCDASANNKVQSGFLASKQRRAKEIAVGELITLTWKPDRKCVIKHLGNGRFKIVEAENTRLCVGDTFSCHLFILHEPLLLDSLVHNGGLSGTYIIGRENGIVFY